MKTTSEMYSALLKNTLDSYDVIKEVSDILLDISRLTEDEKIHILILDAMIKLNESTEKTIEVLRDRY